MIEHSELSARLDSFAAERDWDQFHTPKNLAMALAGESGELLALLQWMSDAEIASGLSNADFRRRFSGELADILLYLVRLADVAGIDLADASQAKLESNERRYDVQTFRGTNHKAPHGGDAE